MIFALRDLSNIEGLEPHAKTECPWLPPWE